jgi:hypothetical protein
MRRRRATVTCHGGFQKHVLSGGRKPTSIGRVFATTCGYRGRGDFGGCLSRPVNGSLTDPKLFGDRRLREPVTSQSGNPTSIPQSPVTVRAVCHGSGLQPSWNVPETESAPARIRRCWRRSRRPAGRSGTRVHALMRIHGHRGFRQQGIAVRVESPSRGRAPAQVRLGSGLSL